MSQPALLRDASLLALKGKSKCFLSWEQSRAMTILGSDSDGCDATAHGQWTQPGSRSFVCFPYPQGFRLPAPPLELSQATRQVKKGVLPSFEAVPLDKGEQPTHWVGKACLGPVPSFGLGRARFQCAHLVSVWYEYIATATASTASVISSLLL